MSGRPAGKLREAAAGFFQKLPSEKELANTGLTRADFEYEVGVWPETWPIFELFRDLETQWDRDPMGGKCSLKYQVAWELLDRRGYVGDEWESAREDLKQMELAALAAMNDKWTPDSDD